MNTLTLMTPASRLDTFKPIEFDGFRILGLWAKLSRPGLKPLEFETFRILGGHIRPLLADPNLKRLKA